MTLVEKIAWAQLKNQRRIAKERGDSINKSDARKYTAALREKLEAAGAEFQHAVAASLKVRV